MTGIHSSDDLIPGECARWAERWSGASISQYSCLTPFPYEHRDPNLLIRAVRYLAHTHAVPPMGKDTRWFFGVLDVLVKLACPNTGLPRRGTGFVSDVRRGLSANLKTSNSETLSLSDNRDGCFG